MSPRKAKVLQTTAPSRLRFAAWLRAVKDGVYTLKFDHGGADEHYFGDPFAEPFAVPMTQRFLADTIGVSERHLRDVLSGKDGVSLGQAWLIGEQISDLKRPYNAGREWCSGILAVAAVPVYRVHVLRWLGALLRTNNVPSKEIAGMWSLLRHLAENPDASARPLTDVTWNTTKRKMCEAAWRDKGDVGDPIPDGTPWVIRAAILFEESVGSEKAGDPLKIDASLALADSGFRTAMSSWFDGIAANWKSVKNF